MLLADAFIQSDYSALSLYICIVIMGYIRGNNMGYISVRTGGFIHCTIQSITIITSFKIWGRKMYIYIISYN